MSPLLAPAVAATVKIVPRQRTDAGRPAGREHHAHKGGAEQAFAPAGADIAARIRVEKRFHPFEKAVPEYRRLGEGALSEHRQRQGEGQGQRDNSLFQESPIEDAAA